MALRVNSVSGNYGGSFSTNGVSSGLALPVAPALHCGLSISLGSILKPSLPPVR